MDWEEQRRRRSERSKAYYAANREKILARMKARPRERVREINRKAVAKYHATHREEQAAYAKRRRAANLEEAQRKDREAKAVWYAANQEEARRRAREYGNGHPEERKVRASTWRANNPDRVKELSARTRKKRKERWVEFLESERHRYRRNYDADPGKYNAKGAARRAATLRATPPWCDLTEIIDIYRRAQQLARETGIDHDVDHIIPLRGRTVWGLHIPINLQILPASANRRKSNRLLDGPAAPNHNAAIHTETVAGSAAERSVAAHSRGRSSSRRQKHGIDVARDQALPRREKG